MHPIPLNIESTQIDNFEIHVVFEVKERREWEKLCPDRGQFLFSLENSYNVLLHAGLF